MQASISEDFGGVEMCGRRGGLIKRLDELLEDLEEFSSRIANGHEVQRELEKYLKLKVYPPDRSTGPMHSPLKQPT